MRVILAAALLALSIAGAALAQTRPEDAPLPVAVSLIRTNGVYSFRDDDGRALYFYDRDTANHSTCEGPCATAWPPVTAPTNAHRIGEWAPLRRADGTLQWAYRGKPIYHRALAADGSEAAGAAPGWRVASP